jgi:hypothetical protein
MLRDNTSGIRYVVLYLMSTFVILYAMLCYVVLCYMLLLHLAGCS